MRTLSAFLLTFLLCGSSALRAQLKVYFVDVGQGDAIYIEFPNGKNALVDGGPNGSKIGAFLKAKGITTIDYVALTHPHSDHYRGLKKVFADFAVKHFYDTRAENADAAGDNNLRELAAAEPHCRSHFPEPGQELDWDPKVTVKVLNACSEPVVTHENDETNNCSLVLRLYYNGNGILLTGDAESSIENAMMRVFKSGLRSEILKVAHHGSRYSSGDQFLRRVEPKYAFISAGLGNVYGHPHQETLDRLKAIGAKIFLTTSGTQTVLIPAPGKGISSPPEPIINETVAASGAALEEMKFTLAPAELDGMNSEAFKQLQLQR